MLISSNRNHLGLNYERGNVLIAGLIFVMILTVLGVGAMQSSNLEYRMSTNTAFKKQAFEYSESGRASITQILALHLREFGWPASITLDAGLTVLDNDGTAGLDLLSENGSTELVTLPDADAEYYIDTNGDGTTELVANVSVYSLKTEACKGCAIGQFGGAEGAGKGGGNGGFRTMLQVKSDGVGSANAQSSVATDFRHVIRN